MGGSQNSGLGVTQNNQTGQSGVDLTIQQKRNPTPYRQTEQQRLGGGEGWETQLQRLQRLSEESNEDYRKALIYKMLLTTGISKEEHYQRNRFNKQVSYEDANVKNGKWKVMSPEKSVLHQYDVEGKENVEFVSQDGHHEAVFDSSGNLVTDPKNMGTYNFFDPYGVSGLLHMKYDVKPYLKWGNSPEDTTTKKERIDKSIGLSPDTEMGKNCNSNLRQSVENIPLNFVNAAHGVVVCDLGADTLDKGIQVGKKAIDTGKRGIGEAWRNTTEWTSNAGNTIVNGFQNINPRSLKTGLPF